MIVEHIDKSRMDGTVSRSAVHARHLDSFFYYLNM